MRIYERDEVKPETENQGSVLTCESVGIKETHKHVLGVRIVWTIRWVCWWFILVTTDII